jgi:hypothetical protein
MSLYGTLNSKAVLIISRISREVSGPLCRGVEGVGVKDAGRGPFWESQDCVEICDAGCVEI